MWGVFILHTSSCSDFTRQSLGEGGLLFPMLSGTQSLHFKALLLLPASRDTEDLLLLEAKEGETNADKFR